jgi:hypothetical protein
MKWMTVIYSALHPATTQYTFFSVAHRTFSKIDHILGHNTSFNKYEKIEIIPFIQSDDHNTIKLEHNNKRNRRKYSNTWRLNNTLLHDQWVIKEIREKITKLLEFNENESTTYQNPLERARALLRGKFIAMSVYIKNTESSQLNGLMLHLKHLQKQEQAKPKISGRREIMKIRAKISEIETRKNQYRESRKQKASSLER